MSIWSTIKSKISEVLNRMIGNRTIEQALNVQSNISSEMENAIQLWADMYMEKAPWLKEPVIGSPKKVTSLGLPAMIASEKARTALLEFQSEITTPTEEVEVKNPDYIEPTEDEFGNIIPAKGTPTIKDEKPKTATNRAEFLNMEYQKLLVNDLLREIEYGIAKGGLIIKPYLVENKVLPESENQYPYNIEFDFIQADDFYPLSFDGNGNITEAGFLQTKIEGGIIYRRLEYHKWVDNTVTIINKAYKSTNNNTLNTGSRDLGQEVSLSSVSEWKDLPAYVKLDNILKPLFAYFKMPIANNVDPKSPLGISGFARAIKLIKDADEQYSRLLWEYEGGELAIDVDRDALKPETDSKGNTISVMPVSQERLFRKVDVSTVGDTYQPYAPILRDTSYINGLNTILMRIEDVCRISRGTLSDASNEARTATELKILKQRSFQENQHIQNAIKKTLEDVVYIMNAYCDMYDITPDGDYDISFDFDDSLLTDYDTELSKRVLMMNNGLTSKVETRMWYFGETERQAEQALEKIKLENQEAMETNLIEQSNLSKIAGKVRGTKNNDEPADDKDDKSKQDVKQE